MSTSFHLRVPRQLYTEMVAHAQTEYPNECCGFLAGNVEAGVGLVVARHPLVNALASATAYLSDPTSLFSAHREMRQAGTVELAIYHSHPSTDPVPSRTDREQNYSTEVVNIIIGLKEKEPSVRAWWLTNDDFREAEFEVV